MLLFTHETYKLLRSDVTIESSEAILVQKQLQNCERGCAGTDLVWGRVTSVRDGVTPGLNAAVRRQSVSAV